MERKQALWLTQAFSKHQLLLMKKASLSKVRQLIVCHTKNFLIGIGKLQLWVKSSLDSELEL